METRYNTSISQRNIVYTRVKDNGSWGEWERLVKEDDIPALPDNLSTRKVYTIKTGYEWTNDGSTTLETTPPLDQSDWNNALKADIWWFDGNRKVSFLHMMGVGGGNNASGEGYKKLGSFDWASGDKLSIGLFLFDNPVGGGAQWPFEIPDDVTLILDF